MPAMIPVVSEDPAGPAALPTADGETSLVRALGYPLKNGIDDSVDAREIVVTYYPGSNPGKEFFKTQAELDAAAKKLGLSTKAP